MKNLKVISIAAAVVALSFGATACGGAKKKETKDQPVAAKANQGKNLGASSSGRAR